MKAYLKISLLMFVLLSLVLTLGSFAEEPDGDSEPEVVQESGWVYMEVEPNEPEFAADMLDANDIDPECY